MIIRFVVVSVSPTADNANSRLIKGSVIKVALGALIL